MTLVPYFLRSVIFFVAIWVIASLIPVVVRQWYMGDGCPALGAVPACYVVLAAYAAIGLAVVLEPRRTLWLFMIGWLPVFLLAASGSTLEVFGRPTCPATSGGTPMCYYSLLVSALLLPGFLIARNYLRAEEKSRPQPCQ